MTSNSMQIPNPSKLRNYLYEYVLIALFLFVTTLFYMYVKMNDKIIEVMTKQINDNSEVMKQNTNALNQYLNFQRFNQPPQRQ